MILGIVAACVLGPSAIFVLTMVLGRRAVGIRWSSPWRLFTRIRDDRKFRRIIEEQGYSWPDANDVERDYR